MEDAGFIANFRLSRPSFVKLKSTYSSVLLVALPVFFEHCEAVLLASARAVSRQKICCCCYACALIAHVLFSDADKIRTAENPVLR